MDQSMSAPLSPHSHYWYIGRMRSGTCVPLLLSADWWCDNQKCYEATISVLVSLVKLDGNDRALNGAVSVLRSILPVLNEALLSALISLVELARDTWTLGFAISFFACEGSYPQELRRRRLTRRTGYVLYGARNRLLADRVHRTVNYQSN